MADKTQYSAEQSSRISRSCDWVARQFWMLSECLVWIKTCIICWQHLCCICEGHIYARTRVRLDLAKSWQSLGHYYPAGTGIVTCRPFAASSEKGSWLCRLNLLGIGPVLIGQDILKVLVCIRISLGKFLSFPSAFGMWPPYRQDRGVGMWLIEICPHGCGLWPGSSMARSEVNSIRLHARHAVNRSRAISIQSTSTWVLNFRFHSATSLGVRAAIKSPSLDQHHS